jgi:hypothetical protein
MRRWRRGQGGATLLPFIEAAEPGGTVEANCIGMPPAVNCRCRMAGGQCPLKGGAIDHHRCHGELVNQLTRVLTN